MAYYLHYHPGTPEASKEYGVIKKFYEFGFLRELGRDDITPIIYIDTVDIENLRRILRKLESKIEKVKDFIVKDKQSSNEELIKWESDFKWSKDNEFILGNNGP